MGTLAGIVKQAEERGAADAKRFAEHDERECMLCSAYGEDKRSLWISCFYAVYEAVPEAIDLSGVEKYKGRGYYLRICKSCRGVLLKKMQEWRDERVALRGVPKDHDGYLEEGGEYSSSGWSSNGWSSNGRRSSGEVRSVPVRRFGVCEMMTEEEYWEYMRAKEDGNDRTE